ncbi:hypothetical protein SARC_03843 [Sphaeroforma arctica JP610]|uniref:Coilin tudor domain-containing protein n=1 Tax=Sphaeroforma arctica JP610 TaxID=667725 RepID=A0A0L0G6R6_9EUKA|nr:hypothetical protein SARC_03843 [Sphaeroforma arctica JP610]KNC83928.1 hypothetical protein SARC_03843 [Sphaeroforma arctica JP610]|eukprot:XP_014157830.1 hypothetical protein SARC_03843 [Sphaeroforma arctica JP610]
MDQLVPRDVRVRLLGIVNNTHIKQWHIVDTQLYNTISTLAASIYADVVSPHIAHSTSAHEPQNINTRDSQNGSATPRSQYVTQLYQGGRGTDAVINVRVSLSMDGYLLPPYQPTTLLRDGDLVQFDIVQLQGQPHERDTQLLGTADTEADTHTQTLHTIKGPRISAQHNTSQNKECTPGLQLALSTLIPSLAVASIGHAMSGSGSQSIDTHDSTTVDSELLAGGDQADALEKLKGKRKRGRKRTKSNTASTHTADMPLAEGTKALTNGTTTPHVRSPVEQSIEQGVSAVDMVMNVVSSTINHTEGEGTIDTEGGNTDATTNEASAGTETAGDNPTAGAKKSRRRSRKSKKASKAVDGDEAASIGESAAVGSEMKDDAIPKSKQLEVATSTSVELFDTEKKDKASKGVCSTAAVPGVDVAVSSVEATECNSEGTQEKKSKKRKRSSKRSHKTKKARPEATEDTLASDQPAINTSNETGANQNTQHDIDMRGSDEAPHTRFTAATQGVSSNKEVAVTTKEVGLEGSMSSDTSKENTQYSSLRSSKGTIGGVSGTVIPVVTTEIPVSTAATSRGGVWDNTADAGESGVHKKPRVVYDKLPALEGKPRKGDVLVFKMMEMDANYCPGLSKFKEGTVSEYDVASDTAVLKLRNHGNKNKHINPYADPDNWYYHSDEPRDRFDMGDEFAVDGVVEGMEDEIITTMAALMDVRLIS